MSVDPRRVPAAADLDPPTEDTQRSLTVNAEMVRRLLPEFDQVSITLIDEAGGFFTCAQAGDTVRDLDRLQYDLGEGPCIDSLLAAEPVLAPRIERDERWRSYVSSATGLGLRSQIATPLMWREGSLLGALNMYSTTREDVAPTAPLIAQALAVQIAGALASLLEIENLHRAVATRKTIGMAIGLLMAQYELTEAAAFAVLQRRSSHANVKLRDIAAQMVAEHCAAGLDLPSAATC